MGDGDFAEIILFASIELCNVLKTCGLSAF
jgi:hypothetical protein